MVTARERSERVERTQPDGVHSVLEDAAENAHHLIQSVDLSGRILYTNRTWRQTLGYSVADVAGLTIFDIVHPSHLAHCRELLDRIARGQDVGRVGIVFRAKDGSEVPLEGTISCASEPGRPPTTIAAFRDVREPSEVDEALRESEARYRNEQDFSTAILDAAANLMVVLDWDGTVLRFNRACEELSGYRRDEVEGRRFWAIIGRGDRNEARRLRDAFKTRDANLLPPTYEHYSVTRDGRRRLISWSTSALQRPGAAYIIASGTDITQSREWEEALAESERRFRSAFDDAAIGMALVAPDGRWLKVNRSLCEILGYTEEELLATDYQSTTHPGDREMDRVRVRQLLEGEVEKIQSGEKRYIHKRGHIVWARVSASLMSTPYGQPQYFIAQIEDVTARKRAEDAQRLLVEAGAALSSSIDYSTTLTNVAKLIARSLADFCLIDLIGEDGRIRRAAGAHRDSALQPLVDELLEDDLPANSGSAIAQVISTGEPRLLLDIDPEASDLNGRDEPSGQMKQRLRPTSGMIVPLESREGVIGAISILLSHPAPRYTGSDLGLARDLARRAAMALDNAKLYRQAREALASRDALLSVVSHDIRNDLIAIGAFARILPSFVRDDSTPERTRLLSGLEQIRAGVEQADYLVRDLMDFALLQAGRSLPLATAPVDLVALARRVIAQQQQTTTRHTLTLSTTEPDLTGLWDEERLARVLTNLLSNAIKYSSGGQVLVSIARHRDEAGEWAELSVRDQGVGIPEADLPYIFDRFTRARNALHIRGTGLGLYSAKQIAELHGGRISVESIEGAGSVFSVHLPITSQ